MAFITEFGTESDDTIIYWSGDVLDGGDGADVVFFAGTAGSTTDVFLDEASFASIEWVNGQSGDITVADFTEGLDHILIDTPVTLDFADILGHAVEIDGNTTITIGDSTMIVEQVGIADLKASDFYFQ